VRQLGVSRGVVERAATLHSRRSVILLFSPKMANAEHLTILQEGVERWNVWRHLNPRIKPNLSGANLSNVALDAEVYSHPEASPEDGAAPYGIDFSNAILSGAILRNKGELWFSEFQGANLRGADLGGTAFHGGGFQNASLQESNLWSTKFYGCSLENANFSRARMYGTFFTETDLSKVVGLDQVVHQGPSPFAVDSLYRSGGVVPEAFLRGAGVPEDFITYVPSLVGKAIQFYSCFISYSTQDQEFSDRLHADLQNKGVRCWFASHNIHGGKKINEQIDEAIRLYDKLLLILSPASMDSDWVKTEIAHARQKEVRDKRRVLFPISLVPFEEIKTWKNFDADTGKDSAREIREYFIPDFTDWKQHDAYSKAFDRLLRDLKT
jgi:hypothetical protein